MLALILGASLGLGGCGKKANHVFAPDGKETDTFPRQYPNPETDPKPDMTR